MLSMARKLRKSSSPPALLINGKSYEESVWSSENSGTFFRRIEELFAHSNNFMGVFKTKLTENP